MENVKNFIDEVFQKQRRGDRIQGGFRKSTFIPPEDPRKRDLSPVGVIKKKINFS